jgi:hypothetical protein
MDAMANGTYLEPENSRVLLIELLRTISTEELLEVVKEYRAWINTGKWTLVYTMAHIIWQDHFSDLKPNRLDGPLFVYDGICRELASRLLTVEQIKQD